MSIVEDSTVSNTGGVRGKLWQSSGDLFAGEWTYILLPIPQDCAALEVYSGRHRDTRTTVSGGYESNQPYVGHSVLGVPVTETLTGLKGYGNPFTCLPKFPGSSLRTNGSWKSEHGFCQPGNSKHTNYVAERLSFILVHFRPPRYPVTVEEFILTP
ncbi:uncharacterized protein B0I36DRAFT_353761 [Microdochium trichocladiopsis]|uniref:Uncharacterized protein n=1 Tax=Microdochium trichocladiopsis TaxID=1682393 RepID=A0A9P9BKB5_9PEZI|nr:uncharacterized protein B0I36DRAFT_353761 [Microdochium trichocladiopsis]KAH7021044.1 hypothetical protein B0I36DRAFT_353761 [Microdochium trichocladiopsis]